MLISWPDITAGSTWETITDRDVVQWVQWVGADQRRHEFFAGASKLKAKIKRLLTSILPVSNTRYGHCVNCGACCKLPKACIFLRYHSDGKSYCTIYALRPSTCRKYPRVSSEFLTPNTCGYSFGTNIPDMSLVELPQNSDYKVRWGYHESLAWIFAPMFVIPWISLSTLGSGFSLEM